MIAFLLVFVVYAVALSLALARAGHRSQVFSAVTPPGPTPSRILIIGATGGTGRHLVEQALARGCVVTALVRDPSRVHTVHPHLTILQGDVLDEHTVHAAMDGQEAVLCALGHRRYYSPSGTLTKGTGNLLRAMKRHNVRRLVCETSLGIGDSAGRLGLYYTFFVIPAIVPLYFWDKAGQEREIADSDVDWVIVRPGLLTDNERSGHIRHGFSVGSFLLTESISRADVAKFMLDQLAPGAYHRCAPGIVGDPRQFVVSGEGNAVPAASGS
jgi:uncharacterized protein YbjT (DUF2867 family)